MPLSRASSSANLYSGLVKETNKPYQIIAKGIAMKDTDKTCPSYSEKQGITYTTSSTTRPSSSGLESHRTASRMSLLKSIHRWRSFYVEKANIGNMNQTFLKSIKMSNDAPLSAGQQNSFDQKVPQKFHTESNTNIGEANEPFDSYIISEGRLVRRDSVTRWFPCSDPKKQSCTSNGSGSAKTNTDARKTNTIGKVDLTCVMPLSNLNWPLVAKVFILYFDKGNLYSIYIYIYFLEDATWGDYIVKFAKPESIQSS